ncbi:HAD family phosphatase [Anaerorhabdus sp.]|nr:HAD family phosphatase [Anaerorhabdus sp.]MEA4876135.1 HAD family phosphatase [Anaerorhabdus sp.]
MINCVILDCDGTMFDTERLAKQAYEDFARSYSIELDQDFWRGICGTGLKFAMPQINRFPAIRDNIKTVMKMRLDYITEGAMSEKDALVKPGLFELLDACKKNNVKIAIASSSHFEYVKMLLDHMTREFEFDFILCGDMVKNKKPDPEIFNTVIENLHVNPAETLILEDSLMGLIASKKANALAGFIEDCVEKNDEIDQLLDYDFASFYDVIPLVQQ